MNVDPVVEVAPDTLVVVAKVGIRETEEKEEIVVQLVVVGQPLFVNVETIRLGEMRG